MEINWHRHHMIPKHAGGTDKPSNIIKVNVPMHIFLHEQRFKETGDRFDRLAARLLRGELTLKDRMIEIRRINGLNRKGIKRPDHSELSKKRGFADVMNTPEQKAKTSKIRKELQSQIISTPDGEMRLREAAAYYNRTRPAITHRCKSDREEWIDWRYIDGYSKQR